jgi:hypothetical protein
MDCFTLRIHNDGTAGRLHISPFALSALPKCNAVLPMTTPDLILATKSRARHCEPAGESNPVYPHGLLHPAGSQ